MSVSLTAAAFLVFIVSALGVLLASFSESRSKDKIALRRIEAKLDQMLLLSGAVPVPGDLEEVHEAIRLGKTIQAVKAYREATGATLLDAKQAVDRLTEGGPGSQPRG